MEQKTKNRSSNLELRTSWTLENRTSNTFKHPIWAQIQTSNLTNISITELFSSFIYKNGPTFIQNLQILAKNRTSNLPNITKSQTVGEHWTVCSTSKINHDKVKPHYLNLCSLRIPCTSHFLSSLFCGFLSTAFFKEGS